MLGHVEWVTPSTHNSSIQIGLKLDTVKRVQIIAPSVRNETAGQNAIQDLRTARVARWREIQLEGKVLGYPLCQLERKKLQQRVVMAVSILESLLVLLADSRSSKKLWLQQHDVERWSAVEALQCTRMNNQEYT